MWLAVAGDEAFPVGHRTLAVSAFFHGCIPDGTTVGELATLLDRPGWLREHDVDVVTAMAGKVPVRFSPDETVIVLRPWLGGDSVGAVYLAVNGHFDDTTARAILCRNAGDAESRRAPIVEKGFDATLAQP